jgi:hypothetical protein
VLVDGLSGYVEMVGHSPRNVSWKFLNVFNNITPDILTPSAHPDHGNQPLPY